MLRPMCSGDIDLYRYLSRYCRALPELVGIVGPQCVVFIHEPLRAKLIVLCLQRALFPSQSLSAVPACSSCLHCEYLATCLARADADGFCVGFHRLGFGFWGYRNPISTKIELGCLGLAGVLWLGENPQATVG